MVESQVRPTDVTDTAILSAMFEIPREEFVPAEWRALAYIDEDIEIADGRPGRFLMQASTFAKLIQLAEIRASDLVLDVGCGTGYSTAVLAHVAGFVVALDNDQALVAEAERNLSALGCENVTVVQGPLPAGHAAQAPYDVIVVEGAIDDISPTLLEQLKDGGRLVAVVGEGNAGRATLWRKESGQISSLGVFNAAVRPLVEFRREPVFEF